MDTPAAGILLFVFILSYLAFRSAFFGLKLLAAMGWFGWVIYCIAHPPFGLVAGEASHIAIIVVSIGIGLMIVLAGLGRGIQRTEKWEQGEQSSEAFHFKIPDWMKMGEESLEERSRKREASLEEYKERMHRALFPKRRKG